MSAYFRGRKAEDHVAGEGKHPFARAISATIPSVGILPTEQNSPDHQPVYFWLISNVSLLPWDARQAIAGSKAAILRILAGRDGKEALAALP